MHLPLRISRAYLQSGVVSRHAPAAATIRRLMVLLSFVIAGLIVLLPCLIAGAGQSSGPRLAN